MGRSGGGSSGGWSGGGFSSGGRSSGGFSSGGRSNGGFSSGGRSSGGFGSGNRTPNYMGGGYFGGSNKRRLNNGGCLGGCLPGGCGCMSFVVAFVIFMMFLFAINLAVPDDINQGTETRIAIDSSLSMETPWYQDNNTGSDVWITAPSKLEYGMEYFFEKTGVRPFLLINNVEQSVTVMNMTSPVRLDYVKEQYEALFDDGAHALFIISDNGRGDWRYDDYIGSAASTVVDLKSINIIYDNFDKYWSSDDDEETLFSKSFKEAADKIMEGEPDTTSVSVFFLVAGTVFLIVYFVRKRKRKSKDTEIVAEHVVVEQNYPPDSFEDCKASVEKYLHENASTPFFREKMTAIAQRIGALGTRSGRIKEIILQRFGTDGLSYDKFVAPVDSVQQFLVSRTQSLVAKMTVFDEEEYASRITELMKANRVAEAATYIDLEQEYKVYAEATLKSFDDAIIKLDRLVLEISKISEKDVDSAMNIMHDLDSIIDDTKFYNVTG